MLLLVVGSGAVGAQAPPDDAMNFQPGDMFAYSLRMEDSGGVREGRLSIWASETDAGHLHLLLSGDFAGINFTTAAQGPVDDPMALFSNLGYAASQDLPYDPEQFVQFLFMVTWAFITFDDTILQVGFDDTVTTPHGGQFNVAVPGQATVGGMEGYAVELSVADEPSVIEVLYNPDLPLPVRGAITDEGFHIEASLKEYAKNRTAPDIPLPPRAHWQGVLHELVYHLQSAGLEIGEVRPHDIRMMDATAALSVTIDGHSPPAELYAFDPETTAESTLERVRAAADSGQMLIPEMSMEIPVVVHDQLMLSSVDYFGGDHHPNKDAIVESFLSF